ncbi:DNA photolyase [Alkalihalobacillus trypoxylicola]|uniref:DNA photolyase n=2 Tax=Alkalihalobacillus trypoxylicola TaxID=519424 RepID=A0A161P6U9_9BACI|nr:radical SAM protein [Alkalihalobacillus trypoxylicola]KYG26106.1 DNA photolyase [Alkalihalobacillus trypoxylicola]
MKEFVNINESFPKKILTPASGFLSRYSHTLNPYIGCQFACSFCYVRQSPVGLFRGEEWGRWVDKKVTAANLLEKELLKLRDKDQSITIFMSSSTDPYQPLEYKENITRSLLEVMAKQPPDFLLLQTRSPLVVRDIDFLVTLKDKVRVSMSIETDLDSVRKRFMPQSPPIQARMKAVEQLRENGIPVQVAVAPILPFSEQFPFRLSQLVNRIVLDDFFSGDGSGGKRTERLKISELYEEKERELWYGNHVHLQVYEKMRTAYSPDAFILVKKVFNVGCDRSCF